MLIQIARRFVTEFSEALDAVFWSESGSDGSKQVRHRPPAPRMIDSQGDVSQNVIGHAHKVLRNSLKPQNWLFWVKFSFPGIFVDASSDTHMHFFTI